jgi:ABC-type nickel/cobalt efflux system permease component RcnA
MLSVLSFGFLLGLRHAIEADHVAAVASLASRTQSVRRVLPIGVLWGLGHTATLALFGALVLIFDAIVPAVLSQGLEAAVGVMLILLGADVLYRLWRERIHFHLHKHGPDAPHFHAHTHQKSIHHEVDPHNHKHPSSLPLRAFLVGSMHGMAGSAALILLTLQSVDSTELGLIYIGLFGVGSIAGMALLSVAIAVPMAFASKGLTQIYVWFRGAVGAATVGLGIFTLVLI